MFMRVSFVCIAVLMLSLSLIPLSGQAAASEGQAKIIINIPGKTLDYYKSGQLMKRYKIGVGTKGHQTPTGKFKIVFKEINPTWVKPLSEGEKPVVIESGPDNPLGYRWMEFSGLYGIHGTNLPDSIGGYVSNGCIRMKESDVEELYKNTPLQTPVEVIYERIAVEDNQGGTVLHIYADEYDIKPLTIEDVDLYLKERRVEGLFNRDELKRIIADNKSKSFPIEEVFSVMIFGKKLSEKAVKINEEVYFPLLPIAQELQTDVSWEVQSAMVISACGRAGGYMKDNILYIKAGGLLALFQLYFGFYPDPHTIYIDYAPLQ